MSKSNTSEKQKEKDNSHEHGSAMDDVCLGGNLDGVDDDSLNSDADEGIEAYGDSFAEPDAGFGPELVHGIAESEKAELRIISGKKEGDEAVAEIRRLEPDIVRRAK